jgi:ApaG protein
VDSLNETYSVDGERVIGEQPLIEPGGSYNYISSCHTKGDFGCMLGYYTMEKKGFVGRAPRVKVKIPTFQFVHPSLLN